MDDSLHAKPIIMGTIEPSEAQESTKAKASPEEESKSSAAPMQGNSQEVWDRLFKAVGGNKEQGGQPMSPRDLGDWIKNNQETIIKFAKDHPMVTEWASKIAGVVLAHSSEAKAFVNEMLKDPEVGKTLGKLLENEHVQVAVNKVLEDTTVQKAAGVMLEDPNIAAFAHEISKNNPELAKKMPRAGEMVDKAAKFHKLTNELGPNMGGVNQTTDSIRSSLTGAASSLPSQQQQQLPQQLPQQKSQQTPSQTTTSSVATRKIGSS